MSFWKVVCIFILSGLLFGQESNQFVHGKNFSLDCSLCHSTQNWRIDLTKIGFDHNQTGFTLYGAHRQVDCQACHQSLVFSHVGSNCMDCHTDIHKGEMGVNCDQCHTLRTWENRFEVFELHQKTRFPLLGVHAIVDCQSCHNSQDKLDFKLKPVDCNQCHLEAFMGTLNPAHQKAGFSLDCQRCHLVNAANWKQAIYEHSQTFPLSGGHAGIECIDCHSDRYQGLSVACFSCHQQDYRSTTNPNHQVFGFPTVCEQCHTSENWQADQFDHLAVSGFALEGVHGRPDDVRCIDCHVNNQLQGLPRDCYGCHQKDFLQTTDPDHVDGGFQHDCLVCHNQEAWQPAEFDHDQTAFPLTGAHGNVNCEQCHVNGQFSGTPTDCYSCHQAKYETTTDPDHQKNGFSHDCNQCHSTSAWQPATFDHTETNFPLTGAHQNVNCIECHQDGYANTPTACVACHQQDYDDTNDPNHRAAGFPTSCDDCHSTSAWTPANWDHDSEYFPIYSGAHKDEWNVCADCHVNTSDYSQFECINCHEHSRSKMDDKHKEVTNYVYESRACYDCHPNGKEGDGDD